MNDFQTLQASATDRPLVTFALFAYNQEKYICEAVGAALAQTYEPLEIILSDDCSTDRTFELMNELANKYTGNHKIIINKNNSNLGLGSHINKVIDLSLGQLIVMAAGDDISLPNRTKLLVAKWLDDNKPLVICSSFYKINDLGHDIPYDKNSTRPDWINAYHNADSDELLQILYKFLDWDLPGLYGSTSCLNRELFEKYSPLRSDVWYEDRVFFLRALLENRLSYAKEEMVFYRSHVDSFTNIPDLKNAITFDSIKREEKLFIAKSKKRIGHLIQHLVDIQFSEKNFKFDKSVTNKLVTVIEKQIETNKILSTWWSVHFLRRVLIIYPKIKSKGTKNQIQWARRRLMPFPLFLIIARIKRAITS